MLGVAIYKPYIQECDIVQLDDRMSVMRYAAWWTSHLGDRSPDVHVTRNLVFSGRVTSGQLAPIHICVIFSM